MIVLTGATGAIGSELIEHLAQSDEVLGIFHATVPPEIFHDRVRYVRVNLEDPQDIKSFARKELAAMQRITLVHAAVRKSDALAVNVDVEVWDQMMRINLRANMLMNQALLPVMIRQRWGRIIHFSSLGGMRGCPGTIAYSTCKAGLNGISNVLAQEYARFGITSNIIALGYFESRLFRALLPNEQRKLLESIPSKMLGDVSNIAHAIAFLMKSDYVNGSTIHVDGGAR